ncbi:MAG: GNAT family N-acetyltransferase [Bacteroidaceae bacterium]|nr:GNAT family N-acetyltransferase [Bacteroidaceae bacterium]
MLTIRKAELIDCQLIQELASIIFPHTYQEILSPEQLDFMMDWMYSLENLRKQMTEEGHVYQIAYQDDKPIGYVSVQPQGKNEEGVDTFHLQKIYVLPSVQGTGAGKFLFEHAIQYIKEVHPEPCLMELNVNRNNKAVSFYEHLGMSKLRQGDFPIGNGYYMNDYIMGLEL